MRKSLAALIWILPVIAHAQGQPTLVSVAFNPATVIGGASSTATITISAPAKQNGLDVTLSFNATVAHVTSSTINIPEGQSSKTVAVDTDPVATQQVVILTASTRADTKSGAITVSPPSLFSITVAPASVQSGNQSTATITLTGNAPSGGFPVSVSSNNSLIGVPASVSIPANQRTANVNMTAGRTGAQTSVALTAAAGGISKTTTLIVTPVPMRLASFEYPAAPVSGETVMRTLTLDAPALSGGALVQLSWSGTNILQVNSQSVIDTIPEGRTSITKRNKVPLTSTDRPFELTATLNGASKVQSGTLKPPTITSLSIADSLFEGTTTMLVASFNGTAPDTGLPVAIKSDNDAAIMSPGVVSFSGGPSSGYEIRAKDVSSRTPVTLTVNHNGIIKRVSTTVIPSVPRLTGFTVAPASVRGGQPVTVTATINVPAPPGGTVVYLNEFPGLQNFDLPDSLLIPQGATNKAIAVATRPFALPLRTEVQASLERISMFQGQVQRSVSLVINP